MTTYQSLDPVPKSLEREGKFYGRKPDEPVLLNTKERFLLLFCGFNSPSCLIPVSVTLGNEALW